MQGFKQFILRGNVIDLGVGIVIGQAFNNVVQSFVANFLNPLLAILTGHADFSHQSIQIGVLNLKYGDFLNALVSFFIIACTVYFFVVMPTNRLITAVNSRKKTEDPSTQKCPFCFSEISKEATRCAHCTSKIPAKRK
jgi:large conductance mechanosensitive channel